MGMSENGQGHNGGTLTDEHLRALAYHHKGKYEAKLAAKKTADSELKNAVKIAKAEGVGLDTMKNLIRLETPEGEAAMRAELQQMIKDAAWSGSDIGHQFSFDDIPNRSPISERAYAEGTIAGYKAIDRKAPYEGEPGNEWLRGYADGQARLMEAIDLTAAGMAEIAAEAEAQAAAEEAEVDGGAPAKKRGRPRKTPAEPIGTEPASHQIQ